MQLDLHRTKNQDDYCAGSLFLNGQFECYTLEDLWREHKIFGITAIPPGIYKIILNWSPRFKKILPRLLDVPFFDGILIHKGNRVEDTHGCILVGDEIADGRIPPGKSTPAFDRLYGKLVKAYNDKEEITITITNDF